MNKKGWLFVAFIVLLVATMTNVAHAQPFVQETDTSANLRIIVPATQIYVANENITFAINVLNQNTTRVDNSSIVCEYHFVDDQGITVYNGTLLYDSDLGYWLFQGNFSQESTYYNYDIYCDEIGSELSGFIENSLYVSRTGSHFENENALLPAVVLILGTVGLLFWFGSMIETNKEWQQALKLLTNMSGLFVLLVGAGFINRSLTVLNYDQTLVNISGLTYWVLIFTIVPILLIFLVLFIKTLLEFWQDLKSGEKFG